MPRGLSLYVLHVQTFLAVASSGSIFAEPHPEARKRPNFALHLCCFLRVCAIFLMQVHFCGLFQRYSADLFVFENSTANDGSTLKRARFPGYMRRHVGTGVGGALFFIVCAFVHPQLKPS